MNTAELVRAAQEGNKEAGERMILENSGLIWSVARRFFGRGTDPEDLYQLGCVGFIKAVQGYDESFGTQFSTYAVPKIAGEIRRFLRDDGPIKVSRGLKEKAFAIIHTREKLIAARGREPTLRELSEECGLSVEEIASVELAGMPTESLQRESGEEGVTLENLLGDEGLESKVVEHVALRQTIQTLPEREKKVIYLRYYKGLTQDKAARVLGVSQVQVSRLERRAVQMLRSQML